MTKLSWCDRCVIICFILVHVQVAVIAGNLELAEVIQSHTAEQVGEYEIEIKYSLSQQN